MQSIQFWISAAITALIDVAFILLLTWRVRPSRFRELKWTLVVAAAVLWSAFAILLLSVFWEAYYEYFFPSWLRSGGILLFVPLIYGLFALGFHWLAFRIPGHPILIFCLLGGLESIIEHLGGIYYLKVLEIPFLQEASPISVLAFAFPEYILYWCVVISIAALLHSLSPGGKDVPRDENHLFRRKYWRNRL